MKFGDYLVIDQMGHGASGYVYKAEKDSQQFAVKACTGFDDASLKRFDREIRIAQILNHPNIIHVYDFDMNASNPYFVMDLCDGTIDRMITSRGFDELVALSLQVCNGIKALHDAGILHRDIKPDNILIKNGEVKITDFSFGFFLDHESATLTKSDQLIGTEGYIAPEINRVGGHYATILSDIFSLGCTIYYIFSSGGNPQYYDRRNLNPNIVRIIERCRENSPQARYSTVQELIDELKALLKPIQFLSINELVNHEASLSEAEFRQNAFQLLMGKERWDELIADLNQLKSNRLNDILHKTPSAGSSLLLMLENIYHNDQDSSIQFQDVEVFTNLCAQIFNETSDLLAKQKALDLTLEISVNYNRYPAMRIIKDSMLSKMSDNDVRSLSGYLRSKKDLLGKIEEALGASLSSKIKIVSGL